MKSIATCHETFSLCDLTMLMHGLHEKGGTGGGRWVHLKGAKQHSYASA